MIAVVWYQYMAWWLSEYSSGLQIGSWGFKPKAGSTFLIEEEVVKWPGLEKVGTPSKVHGLNPWGNPYLDQGGCHQPGILILTEFDEEIFQVAWWLSALCLKLQIESQGFNSTYDGSFLMEEGVVDLHRLGKIGWPSKLNSSKSTRKSVDV